MGKYLFKVSKITLEQRPSGRCSNVILLTLNKYLPTGNGSFHSVNFMEANSHCLGVAVFPFMSCALCFATRLVAVTDFLFELSEQNLVTKYITNFNQLE